jgi:hypothetical protein
VKFKQKFKNIYKIILSILVVYFLFASVSCSSEEVIVIADPVFNNLFLSDKVTKKEIRVEARVHNYSLNILEYDVLTNNREITASKIIPNLEKALLNGNQIILSPLLSNMVLTNYTEEGDAKDEVLSLLSEFPVEQIIYWISEVDTLYDNYYRIVRNGSQGWFDGGKFGGTYNSGITAFIYIENDEIGEANALSFSQGTESTGAEATALFTIAKNASATEIRTTLDSMIVSVTDKSVLGVYAGTKTADIIELARNLGLFVICEQAEWLIDNDNETFGTIKENLPVVFERVFERIKKISTPEYKRNSTVTDYVRIIPGQMDFIVIEPIS